MDKEHTKDKIITGPNWRYAREECRLRTTDYSAVAVAALGCRDEENDWLAGPKKVRLPHSEIVQHI